MAKKIAQELKDERHKEVVGKYVKKDRTIKGFEEQIKLLEDEKKELKDGVLLIVPDYKMKGEKTTSLKYVETIKEKEGKEENIEHIVEIQDCERISVEMDLEALEKLLPLIKASPGVVKSFSLKVDTDKLDKIPVLDPYISRSGYTKITVK